MTNSFEQPGSREALSPHSERKLIREYQLAGWVCSRNRLVELLSLDLQSLLARMFPGHPSADDLFQDGCLALMESIDKYDLSHPARVRLLTFVRKRLLGVCTSGEPTDDATRRAQDFELDMLASADSAGHSAELAESRQLLIQILSTLEQRDRDILVHRRLGDRPLRLKDLAAYYGVSKVRIAQIEKRALASAKASLESIYAVREGRAPST